MYTLKWAWAAIAIEVGVFLSPLLHESHVAALLAMLVLHALASAIVASGSYVLLPHKYMRPRVTVWLLLFLFAFVAPLIGAVGMLIIIWTTFRKESLDGALPKPVTVPLPEFDVQAKDVSRSGQGSIRSRLNPHVPSAIRLQSLMTLQAIPTRVANPILDELLSDNSDDVRLVAFGMLDAGEKKINADIPRERRQLDQADCDAQRHTCLRHLAELHWELIYASLAQGELRKHILSRTLQYVEATLALEPEPDAAMLFLKGRTLLAIGEYAPAQAAIEHAITLGHPLVSAVPYVAELAYQRRNFAQVKQSLLRLEKLNVASRTRAVVDIWTGRDNFPHRSDRNYLPHI